MKKGSNTPYSLFKNSSIDISDNYINIETDAFIGKLFTEDIEEYRNLGKHFDPKRIESIVALFNDHSANLTPDSNVLEIGAGLGNYAISFLQSNAKFSTYIINDISQQMLEETERVVDELDIDTDNIYYLQTDICQDIFKPNTFDLIFGSSILHHLLDYKGFLKTVHSILKPSGEFIVSEPFSDPYLIASIVFQLSLYIAEIQNDKYTTEDKEKLDSFCNNVIGRTNLLFSEEELANTDDKYLFRKDDFTELSKEIGFSECIIKSKKAIQIGSKGHFEAFIVGTFRGLKIEPKQNIEIITNLFDKIYPDLITNVMPPQEYIVLRK